MQSHLHRIFPKLRDFRVTSPPSRRYNCIAWAAGVSNDWWWPRPRVYWPPGALREPTLSAFIAAFAVLGYETCDDGALEEGVEKVAIYALQNGLPTHMARQLPSGRWTSKLGEAEDIEHASPAELEGVEYGAVVGYMRRAISPPTTTG